MFQALDSGGWAEAVFLSHMVYFVSYNKPSELNTAIGILFLTWSTWFTFITSMMALRSEYAIFLTLIFASVAVTTGLVGTSHLVAATSEEGSASKLQRVYNVP
jgi:succinate-acetate transporter protein